MTNQPTCSTCKFYDCNLDSCRRHPPVRMVAPHQGSPDTFWPQVEEDDWCGEHQPAALPPGAPPQPVDPAWRDRLSTRAKNCLDSEGTTDAEILADGALRHLLSIRNMGKTTAHEALNKCRDAYGLPPYGKR